MPKARVNGIDVHYHVHGDGPPLVLAHGIVSSTAMFDEQVGPFSQKYRTIVYDVRGHGESEAPPADDPGYSFETFVEDLRALLDHLGVEHAYVGGLSMGGMISMRFALTYPERVRALMLFDTAAEPAGSLRGEMGKWEERSEAIVERARSQGVLATMAWLYSQRGNELLGVTVPKEPPEGVRKLIMGLATMSVDGFLGALRAAGEQTGVIDRLPEITVPTMILTGDGDFMREPSLRMREKLPQSRFVMIKGAAHGTCFWQPEHFTQAMLDFLGDVKNGRPVAGEREY
jgi:pimeloyl-ACP methyl ester carboxylesterase